ncbi:MAG: fructose-bisphosphatase class III, partial [Candidatus Margulisbacteria bacterium]|nr:fructose-bisphosphatase class III [Candidatus Margulisiibacteriota bacterium]
LTQINGKTGREALTRLKYRIQTGMEAWRQILEHGSSEMMEMHADSIHTLALLPWDYNSPLYGRKMQTAARAVLPKGSGTWEEPEVPFFTHFETNADPEMSARARANIAESFRMRDNFVIVRGHKPWKKEASYPTYNGATVNKKGMYQLLADGRVINIDAGMAKTYGGQGGALVFGSDGAAWLAANDMTFYPVPLPNGA